MAHVDGDANASRTVPLAVSVCCANVAAIIFLQRIIVPLGGEQGVSILLPIAWISLTALLFGRLATIDLIALTGCTAFIGIALLSQILCSAPDLSVTSFLLLFAIYVLCSVRISVSPDNYRRILSFFQYCMVAVAVLVLLQYACQLTGLGMPALEDILPDPIIVKNFVYLQEIVWKSGIYKPNGIVMLEASFLSQFIGLALIIEFWVFQRTAMLLLFTVILALTFSGTGMILAGTTLGIMILKRGLDRNACILVSIVVCIALGLLTTGYLQIISQRLSEFSDQDASASVRFIRPIERVAETLRGDKTALLWGSGAGAIDRPSSGYAWNPPVKVWVEYGVFTFAAFWMFLITLVTSTPTPMLTVALALEYLLFGGGALLQPPVVFACFFLGFGYSLTTTVPRAPRRVRSSHSRSGRNRHTLGEVSN